MQEIEVEPTGVIKSVSSTAISAAGTKTANRRLVKGELNFFHIKYPRYLK